MAKARQGENAKCATFPYSKQAKEKKKGGGGVERKRQSQGPYVPNMQRSYRSNSQVFLQHMLQITLTVRNRSITKSDQPEKLVLQAGPMPMSPAQILPGTNMQNGLIQVFRRIS